MTQVVRGSLKSLREGNRERLIGLLRKHGSLHRAELARRAGVSRATVSTIVADLITEGLVVEEDSADDANGGRGRNRAGLTLNPAAGAIVGLDFSAANVVGVLADLSHEVIAQGTRALDENLSLDERLDIGVALVEHLLGEADVDRNRVLGVGLGVPGPVNVRTGKVGGSSKSWRWRGVNVGQRLNDRLGMPVSQDNTAHLGALAEVAWGAAQGCQHVIYVKVSGGVSAGLVIDGRVLRGAQGITGALGHISVTEGGPLCSCGSRGCLELYTSVPSILAGVRPVFGDLTFDDVVTMAQAGQRPCVGALRAAGRTLGRGLAGVCNLLNPDRVVLGGELAHAGDLILDPLRAELTEYALPGVTEHLGVVRGELGDRAGALGGVAMVLRESEQAEERV